MKLVVDKASLVSVADAIRTKGNTSESLEFPKGFVNAVNSIESGGGGNAEEIESIIDASGVLGTTDGTVEDKVEQLIDKAEIEKHIYNASLKKGNCQNEFQYYTGKKLPLTNYANSAYFNNFAAGSSIETVDYYLDWNNGNKTPINMQSAFEGTRNLKTMVGINTKYATSVSSLFHNSSIVSIQEPFDFSNINGSSSMSAFTTAKNLVDVRIVPETWKWGTSIASGVLSNESIKSILRGLAYVETTQALKLHYDIWNKLVYTEDEELYALYDEALVDKGWDIAY